jgi:preprotein translocase subunit SecG
MGFIMFIHIIACILLVTTILMQAGKGGGLAESFASAESMFGTQTNAFMVRCSTILAAIFLATSLTLAVAGTKANKSLMADKKMLPVQTEAAKPASKEDVTVTVSDPKPVETKQADTTKPVVNAAK